MKTSFLVCVTYATLGVIFAPGLYSLIAFVFILISCLPFLVGSLFEQEVRLNVHRPPGPFLFWGAFALGLLNLMIIAGGVDKSPADVFTVDGFVSIAAASTIKRYIEESSSGNPVILALSLFLIYRLGAADTVVSAWRKVLGFMPLLLYSLLTTEKWVMFLSGVFFLSGLFISRPHKEARKVALRYVTIFLILGGGIAGIALVLRGFDQGLMGLLLSLLHYVLAPYSALGYWLLTDATQQCCSLGSFTFIGPLNTLGWVFREAGVYPENFVLYGIETNIYTAWRYLVKDFSLFGPFLLNLSLMLLFIGFRRIHWHFACLAIGGFVTFCSFLSLNVTPFVHNSTAFAMLLSLAYSVVTVFSSVHRLRYFVNEQT